MAPSDFRTHFWYDGNVQAPGAYEKERAMEQARQLVSYTDAMKLSGVPRRTFFKRLKGHAIAVYIDPDDRRLRWLDRRDLEKIAEPVKRGTTAA